MNISSNKFSFIKKEDLHIANFVSILAFIVAFWWNYIIIIDQIQLWFMIILSASILDMLDWYLARKFNSKSNIWWTLDSYADILIYILPIIFTYISVYKFDYLLVFSSIFIFFSSLIRLSSFTNYWFKIIDQKKNYIWMPTYFLFISIIFMYFQINYILINIILIILSILMIANIHFKKANIIISLVYILILFILTYLFLIWIL